MAAIRRTKPACSSAGRVLRIVIARTRNTGENERGSLRMFVDDGGEQRLIIDCPQSVLKAFARSWFHRPVPHKMMRGRTEFVAIWSSTRQFVVDRLAMLRIELCQK